MTDKNKYEIGQRVSLKRNVAKKGRIDYIPPPQGGHQFYEIMFDDGSLQTIPEHELQFEVIVKTPWDLLENSFLNDYRDFSIATTLHKVRNTTTNTISSLKASRTIFKPYQYKPLVKFLKSDLKRILVADEVGLGKTIEAGHIMLELAARGNLNNALVICTNSLRDKWKTELQEKFPFIMKKYASPKEFIEDVKNDFTGSRKSIFGILNYAKCRNKELQQVIEEKGYRFDLLICDEAHKIRNSETAQHKGVSKIVDQSEAVVFLTATPIMTDLSNLHNLIRVLDKEGYDTYDIFNNAIRQNRPFIRALTSLNANQPLQSIAEELHNSAILQEMTADREVYSSERKTVAELFSNDELYMRVRQNMLDSEDSIEKRVKIQNDLIELNSLNHLYSRTRKKDVMSKDDVVQRNPKTIPVRLSDQEKVVYDSVINEYDNQNSLGLIQRKRQMSSCIVAFRTPREELKNGNYDQELPDAKYDAFKSIVDEVVINKGKKLIVFAFFTNTLLYLRNKLRERGIGTEIIYGGVDDRTERIENFQHQDEIKVLLSSEVGSEGIDLQFCDALVNYDLPWNPMVVEQRIGRIDRVGQKSNVINIYNLIIQGTIEERIHNRLYERINLFRESIGDLEEILGETEPIGELISKGIESLYKTKLSENEQNAELDRLRLAIENEKQTLNKIKTELQEAFANDIHFQNEIESITKNNRYLTKEEIIKYLESIIRLELSSLHLNHIDENNSEIEIPTNNKSVLFDFIEKYKDSPNVNPELENLYNKFKVKHIGSRKIPITFDQQHAYNHKKLEYISAFHPLINAITNYFAKNSFDKNQAHKISIQQKYIATEKEITIGYYIVAVYKININRYYGGGKSNELNLLRPVVADLNQGDIQILNSDTSDHLHGIMQINGEQFIEELPPLNKSSVREIRNKISNQIYHEQEEIKEDEQIKFLSGIRRRTEQEVNYIDKRIERIERMLKDAKGTEAIRQKEIEDFKHKREQLLDNQEKAFVEVSHTLISVNFLQIK